MARQASSKLANSTANLGFEGKNGGHSSGAAETAKGSPEGERGGVHQFSTRSCVVRCLVEMLAPYKGRIYDPAYGSGGMFVQSEKFVEHHERNINSYYCDPHEANGQFRGTRLIFLKSTAVGI